MKACVPCAVALLLAAGCASQNGETALHSPATERHPTAGGALYRFAPAGADLAIELDLHRLRDNPVLGPLVATAIEAEFSAGGMDARIANDLDVLLLCAYDIGGAEATTLTLMRGPRVTRVPGAIPVGKDVFALGPPALVARAQAAFRGDAPSLASDREFAKIRDVAMPDGATGAVLRVTAVLDFNARVALSGRLSLEVVPQAVSVWGDVADDLAAVGVLVAENPADAANLALLVERARTGVVQHAGVRLLGIAPAVAQAEISAEGQATMMTFVLPPAMLEQAVARAQLAMGIL